MRRLAVVLALVALPACGGKTPTQPAPAPSITPASANLTPGQTATFSVVNGKAPCAWSLTGGGTLQNCDGSASCTVKAGDQPGTFTVRESTNGLSASFTVPQPTLVTLRFTNGLTNAPVDGASVQVIGGASAVTSGNGEVAVKVYASEFDFDVSVAGYLTFKERFTGVTDFALFPVGTVAGINDQVGYDEQFVKEFFYGDNSRNLGNPRLLPLYKPQANSFSVNLDSGLQAIPEAVANASLAASQLTADLQNTVVYQVGSGSLPANVVLDPNLVSALGLTSWTNSGTWITGTNIKLSNNGSKDFFTMVHELFHGAGVYHHVGPGLEGHGGVGHGRLSQAEINCWLMVWRNREPGWRMPASGGECSPRRQCQ